MKRRSLLLAVVASIPGLFGAGTARAEVNYLWPTFSIGAGGYGITSTDEIEVEGSLGSAGQRVDLEAEIGLPESKTLLQAELGWAFAPKHSVEVSYYSLDRDGSRSIQRTVQVGDLSFPIGASANLSFKTTALEAGYTYWFVRNESFGFGGSVGAVDLSLAIKASASANIGPGGVTVTRRVDESTGFPVPMIGLAIKGSPTRRLVLYARGRLLPEVSVGDYDGEAASYSLGGYYYLIGPVALGASYDGTYYRAEIDQSSWHGSVDLTNDGWRLFLRAAF